MISFRKFWRRQTAKRPWIDVGTQLPTKKRGPKIDQIIIHESVTVSRDATVKVLSARKLGVDFIIDRDGSITEHNTDLRGRYTEHAGIHNARAIGVEVVNSYYATDESDAITGPWVHKGRYARPSEEQLKSAWDLILWLSATYGVPLRFPATKGSAFYWGAKMPESERSGIIAHHRFAHADGLFIEHYCTLRERFFDHAQAYAATVEAASAGTRSTLLPEPNEGLV